MRQLASALLGWLAICLVWICAANARPQRIVSINLCTDQILLGLVERERIAAVSFIAADPAISAGAEAARGIPAVRGDAEAVLAHAPDLVLAGSFSTPATSALLQRLGQRVVRVDLATDLDGVRRSIRAVATAVDEAARGEALVADFDAAITAASNDARGAGPTALVYQVNGLSAGPGTLIDALYAAAGLVNLAPALGLGPGGTVSLEAIVARPPDLLVLSHPVGTYRAAVAQNLVHPALRRVMVEKRSVVVPQRLWLCGTQHTGEAAHLLAAERRTLTRGGVSR